MQSIKPLKVDLDTPYPVFMVYRTAWVDDNNNLNFREDIYGHDKRHLAQLHRQQRVL
jgi:murein L,D-transpeptidase YcbB/YkuD